jgi:hypothetical protein
VRSVVRFLHARATIAMNSGEAITDDPPRRHVLFGAGWAFRQAAEEIEYAVFGTKGDKSILKPD